MRRRALLLAFAALALVLLLVLLGIRWLRGSVTASVDLTGNRPQLVLRLSRIDDGEHVEVLGRDLVVRNGEVRMELGDDSLRIGPNDLSVLHGDDEQPFSLELGAWAFRDDAALSLDPPRLGIVVRTVPGRDVSVDGQRVALSPAGEGRFSIPAPLDGTPADHTFVVRILGGEAQEELRLHAHAEPARLELRQPPVGFVTDRPSIELHVEVDPTATATLDGTRLPLSFGRAHAPLGLSREGDFRFLVEVVQPGAIRRRVPLTVRRTSNLALEALSYAVDRSISYDALVDRPDAHRGAKLELEGRVFNLRADEGRTYLQITTEPCAASSGCPAWIEYPAATLARVGDRIRARGVYVGTQTYRDPSANTTHSSPHLDAAFVVVEGP